MPDFKDFTELLTSKSAPRDISVDDILRAQTSSAGDVSDLEGVSEKLRDVAEMFLHARSQVEKETRIFGDEEIVNQLANLNKGFKSYANNLLQMKYYLDKFADENAEMSKEDTEQLHSLVTQNERIVGSINQQRAENQEFNNQIVEIEKQNEFNFRTKGVMESEQQRLQQKYDLSREKLWSGIAEDIEDAKKVVKDDLKAGIIEGVGGPIGMLATKVFIPGFKVLKDTAAGKWLGQKFGAFGDRLKGLFSKNKLQDQQLLDAFKSQGDVLQKAIGGEEQKAIEGAVSDVASSIDEQAVADTDTAVEDAVDRLVKETVAPKPQTIRKRKIAEDRIDKTLPAKKQEQGVFSRLLDSNIEGNLLLEDILYHIKDQKSVLDDSYSSLTEMAMLSEHIQEASEDTVKSILGSKSEQTKLLSAIRVSTDFQAKKIEVQDRLNEEIFEWEVEKYEEEQEDLKEDLRVQQKILKELENLGKSGGSSGGGLGAGAFGAAAMGPMLAKFAMAAMPYILPVVAAAAVSYGLYEGIKYYSDPKNRKGTGLGDLEDWINRNKELWSKDERERMKEMRAGLDFSVQDATPSMADMTEEQKYEQMLQMQTQSDVEASKPKDTIADAFSRGVLKEYSKVSEKDRQYVKDVTHQMTPSMSDDDILKWLGANSKLDLQIGEYVINWGASDVDKLKMIRELIPQSKDTKQVKTSAPVQGKKGDLASADEQVGSGVPVKREARASLAMKDVQAEVPVSTSSLESEISKVEKETVELDTMLAMGGGQQAQQQALPTQGVSAPRQQGAKKQNLDEISILANDNLGIILVNSGINII